MATPEVDSALIIKASQGDIRAFEEIYKITSSFIYNVAFRFARNNKDAEEITQEVFLRIYKNLKSFRFRSSFKTWAYRITVNTAINFKKQISKEEDKRLAFQSNIYAESLNKNINYKDEGFVEFLLGRLTPEQRLCIVLREIQGLRYKEISEIIGININTVRSRLKRAREKLLALKKEIAKDVL